MAGIRVRIDSLVLPATAAGVDAEELQERTARRLGELLARDPLSPPPGEGRLTLPAARVHAAAVGSTASLADAIAHRVYAALRAGELRP